jgi:hypothetical protein
VGSPLLQEGKHQGKETVIREEIIIIIIFWSDIPKNSNYKEALKDKEKCDKLQIVQYNTIKSTDKRRTVYSDVQSKVFRVWTIQ